MGTDTLEIEYTHDDTKCETCCRKGDECINKETYLSDGVWAASGFFLQCGVLSKDYDLNETRKEND